MKSKEFVKEIRKVFVYNKDVKKLFDKLEKELEVLEILKNKRPRLSFLKSMVKVKTVNYDYYYKNVYSYEKISEEEFNLIKEWLEDDNLG